MKLEGKHVILFLAIAILMVAVVIGVSNTNRAGVSSLGEYGDSDIYRNSVKLEEGDGNVIITPSNAHNGLDFSLKPGWLLFRLPLESFRKGVTAPTETIRSGYAGFLFDADAEELTLEVSVPDNWDGTTTPLVVLECVLDSDETADDIIDWEFSVKIAQDHDDIDTLTPQTPTISHDIDTYTSAGIIHYMSFEIDFSGCSAHDCVGVAMSRTSNVGSAGYADGVLLVGVSLHYKVDKLGGED